MMAQQEITAREWLSDYQGMRRPRPAVQGEARSRRDGRIATEDTNIFGNAASAVNDGWTQFSSFLGGGIGGVFRHPSPSQAAPSHATLPPRREPSPRQPPAGAQKAPLRASSFFVSADFTPSHDSNSGGRPLGTVQSLMGAIARPCVPAKDYGPSIMVPEESTGASGSMGPPILPEELSFSSSSGSMGHPQAAGNANGRTSSAEPSNAHASSAEPRIPDAKRKSQTTATYQQLLGKFRAGQNRWTVVNDDSSKPKEQIGMRNQVAAVECIKTNDFTIVADVGFAQADGSMKEGGHSAQDRRHSLQGESAPTPNGDIYESPQDIFNKMYPISEKDIQRRIAGASPPSVVDSSSIIDGCSPSASPPTMTSPAERERPPVGVNGSGIGWWEGSRGEVSRMALYDTAPRHSNRWSAPLPPEGFVPDLQIDDSFLSVGSQSAVSECRIAVSPLMLQKSTNSWKLLPIPPLEQDSQEKTKQYSEAKHMKTLIDSHHASAHPDTVHVGPGIPVAQVWLPEMGLPPPGALRMPSSSHSPQGRDAAPTTHGHSMQSPLLVSSHRPPSAQVSAARTELGSRSPVDVHSPSMQAAELKNSVARPLHSIHNGAMSGHGPEDGGGARSASRRVDICGDRSSLKADPSRPAFVPALNFPNNINQDSDDEDENPGTVVTVPHGGHSSLNYPLLKHQQPKQQPLAHPHQNQIPQQKRVSQQGVQHWAGAKTHQGGTNMQMNSPVGPDPTECSNLVSFVNGSTVHSQSLHASMPARPSGDGGALAEAPASPVVDIHRSLQQSPNVPSSSLKKTRPLLMRQRYDMIQNRRGTVTPDPKRPSVVPTLKLENIVPSDDSEDDEYVPAPRTPVQKRALSPPLPPPVALHLSLQSTPVR